MSSSSSPTLTLDRLTVSFPEREGAALRDVSEAIESGEFVAITGPSGCGKSTLCRTLCGFIGSLIPAELSGRALVDGVSVFDLDPARVASRLGLVQQDPDAQVCTLRVRSEVAFGPENLCLPATEVRYLVDEALAVVGLSDLAERTTTTLSGGEKQRLAIASILAMQPSAILLDEPTANLDPMAAQQVFELLGTLHREENRTLIVVEHRLAPLVAYRPRLLVMDQGRIVERRSSRERHDLLALGLRTGKIDAAHPGVPPSTRDRIVIRDISFAYTSEPVIDRLSMHIHPGEIVGVIGPNGGGKSTLLRLIAGLEAPGSGDVVRTPDTRIGMVFQHPHQQIFERTVRRELDIEEALSSEQRSFVLRDARLGGLDDVAPLSLSLGEQRRLTVACALRTNPSVLLLDEPFIGQDRRNVAWMVGRLFAHRKQGGSVILVSHDIPLVGSLCDRLVYLNRDTVIEGDPEAVFRQLRERGLAAFTPSFWDEGDA